MTDVVQNRRSTDHPDTVERVVALETNVSTIKDAIHNLGDDLRDHIRDESEVIKDLAMNMGRVVSATEMNATTMERVSATLDRMADHSVRVQSLETWREKAEPDLVKANRMWWAIGLGTVLAPGIWAVATKFGWF